jgi:hypothetical protein
VGSERAGVLLIRVWVDEESGEPNLRARITSRRLADPEQAVTFATTVAEVNTTVTAWLTDFLDKPGAAAAP